MDHLILSHIRRSKERTVNVLIRALIRSGILTEDLDYHVIRASMVIILSLIHI